MRYRRGNSNKIKSSASCPFYPPLRLPVFFSFVYSAHRRRLDNVLLQRTVSSSLVDFLSLGMLLSTFVSSFLSFPLEFHELSLPSSVHRLTIVVLFPPCSVPVRHEESLVLNSSPPRCLYDPGTNARRTILFLFSFFSFSFGKGKSRCFARTLQEY